LLQQRCFIDRLCGPSHERSTLFQGSDGIVCGRVLLPGASTAMSLRGLDAYSFPARVVPILVVFLPPVVLLGVGLISGTRTAIASGAVLTVLGALAGQVGRDRGKRLEPSLWQGWGGGPAERRLRYRDAADAGVVTRLHQRVEHVLGEPLPTPEEERTAPAAADTRYEEAIRRLIGLTRNRTQFRLLFAENVNYGMRRNLLGLRAIGIAVAGITAIVAALLLLLAAGTLSHRAAHYGPALGVALLELVLWTVLVTREWVRVPAEAYADRLIEAVEVLPRANRAQPPHSGCAD
jgi:hypothetical protein